MPDSIAFLPVTELVAHYRAGTVSPVDAVGAAYERLERLEPEINAFCRVADRQESLKRARDAEVRWRERRPLGEMDGVPITVKDAILAKGWPTLKRSTNKSRVRSHCQRNWKPPG